MNEKGKELCYDCTHNTREIEPIYLPSLKIYCEIERCFFIVPRRKCRFYKRERP